MCIFAKYDLLRFSQPEPELPPGGELLLLREVELHLLARVPAHEGGGHLVRVMKSGVLLLFFDENYLVFKGVW